jgi:hypothetical protein
LRGNRGQNNTGDPLANPVINGGQSAHAAAELYGDLHGFQNGFDGFVIHRTPFERAVQIHDMKPWKTLFFKGLRPFRRIRV